MAVSYKRLWKLLIDKDMKKKDLCAKAGISPDVLPSSFIPRRTLPSQVFRQRTEKTSMTSRWATSHSDNIC